MAVCQFCGKENSVPDAAYCLYCGSSLRQPQGFASTIQTPKFGQTYGSSGSGGGIVTSPEFSERYERALAKVEQLGAIVVVLAVVTLILVIV